jgi:hypothetical protein
MSARKSSRKPKLVKEWYVFNKYDANDSVGPFESEDEALSEADELNSYEVGYMMNDPVDEDTE